MNFLSTSIIASVQWKTFGHWSRAGAMCIVGRIHCKFYGVRLSTQCSTLWFTICEPINGINTILIINSTWNFRVFMIISSYHSHSRDSSDCSLLLTLKFTTGLPASFRAPKPLLISLLMNIQKKIQFVQLKRSLTDQRQWLQWLQSFGRPRFSIFWLFISQTAPLFLHYESLLDFTKIIFVQHTIRI